MAVLRTLTLLLIALLVRPPGELDAQAGIPRLSFRAGSLPGSPFQSVEQRAPRPGAAFLASALLPGLGQRILGQERWTPYAAVEVWAWAQYLDHRREGRRLQRQYRDLAWFVARRVSSGFRVDGSFDYYEAVSQHLASGAYDADPLAPGIQPEMNPETFNGVIWSLARQIFLPGDSVTAPDPGSPSFRKALDYYRARAYPPNLSWNWGANTLQLAQYRDLIRSSDENLRRSTTMIGVILANHLLSAVDGLVSGRLGALAPAEPRVEAFLLPTPLATMAVGVRVRLAATRVP